MAEHGLLRVDETPDSSLTVIRLLNEILVELRKLTEPERTVADYTLTGQVATVPKITERAYGKSVPTVSNLSSPTYQPGTPG